MIEWCLEWGRIRIGYHDGDDRMAERNFTGLEIQNTLTRGSLRTESCNAGTWIYAATRRDAEIIFCFTIDDEGNRIVVVTLIRRTQ
ncbi:MAG TPA: hypothetical protein VGM88_28485 [Kofleriaceae bacterium]